MIEWIEFLPHILFIFALGFVYTVPANDVDYPDQLYIIELQDNKLDIDEAEKQSLANLIKNGSFEDSALPVANTPSGWALEGTPTCAPDTGIGFGVPRSIKITGTGAANEGLKQTLSGLKASTVYTIIWDSKATGGDTARLLTTGGAVNADEDVVAVGWANSSATFTIDAGATNVVLKAVAKAAGDIVWFDNIMVLEGTVAARYSPHPNDQHLKAIDFQDTAPANFDYGILRMECGQVVITYTGAESTKAVVVTFGTAFSKILVVTHWWLESGLTDGQKRGCVVSLETPLTTGFTGRHHTGDSTNPDNGDTITINWVAIGVN